MVSRVFMRLFCILFSGSLILFLAAPAGAVTAPSYMGKLSGQLPSFGDAMNYQISPDGQYVVFSADTITDGTFDLFSAPLASGTRVQLNPAVPLNKRIPDFHFSPNGARVVYRLDSNVKYTFDLYSVPTGGPSSASVRLNNVLPTNGSVRESYVISPDSSRVYYVADQDTPATYELYVVSLDGSSAPIKLNEALTAGFGVYDFKLTPAGEKIIYVHSQSTDAGDSLYIRSINKGDTPTLLNIPAEDGWVKNVQISPDGSRVVYATFKNGVPQSNLYSVPVSGTAGDRVRLNPESLMGPNVGIAISPNSQRVVYGPTGSAIDDRFLASVPIAGPSIESVVLTGNDGDTFQSGFLDVTITPDSSRVIYLSAPGRATRDRLYSVPIAGPKTEAINLHPFTDPDYEVMDYQLTPDGTTLVYQVERSLIEPCDQALYRVPVTGPASARVRMVTQQASCDITSPGVYGTDFSITPDGQRVVFTAYQPEPGGELFELFSLRLFDPGGGFTPSRINQPLVSGGDVQSFELVPFGQGVVYQADKDTNEVSELYITHLRDSLFIPIIRR